MLEELAMEKKNSVRSGQGPSKGSCTETKKLQDATIGKQFPRNGRKKENPNSNGPKFDQSRKPLPQKSKTLDKRPKSRGLYFDSGKENSQIRDDEFAVDFGSFENGSKKQSLNHLLNFHYEPRGENLPKRAQQPVNGNSTKALMATQAHKYNKEQFLQANCQFVVREGGDYTFNMGDPDLLVDWGHVELIVRSSCEEVVCPICLYPPLAGKITRCGHIYCWSCILHYLALSDKSWRKCPICFESIHKQDLKSVECIVKELYSVGHNITMRLMKREKGTLVAIPVSQFNARTSKTILSYGETEVDTVYSKLLTASHDIVSDIISQEQSALQSQVEESKGCPELCFVEQALELLAQRKSLLESSNRTDNTIAEASLEYNPIEYTTNEISISNDASGNAIAANDSSTIEDNKSVITDSSDDLKSQQRTERSKSESVSSEGDEIANINAEDLEINTSNRPQKYFYFYQAIDGQQIYLHSINVKMLEMTYGSLENSPVEIVGKIVEIESGSMTSQLRNRLRYLQHVPITCQFEVVELDIRPPILTNETVIHFQDQVDERRKRRHRQARAEKRREKKIEEIEMKQFNRRPTPNLRIDSRYHFPECGMSDLPRSCETPSVKSQNSSRSESPNYLTAHREKSPLSSGIAALSLDSEDSGSAPSFAQLLQEGKTVTHGSAWPSIGSNDINKKTSSSAAVWPRRQRMASVTQDLVDSDNETAFSPPARPSFNIAEAILLAASIEKGDNNTGGGRKKKKKPKLLFSTGMPKGN